MPKSAGQKLKMLYLMRILLSETDEAHPLSVNEIISKLAGYGINAERKTVYDDMEALRRFGIDIIMEKSKSYGYYVAGRDFELPELKLLVNAVESSKFITEKKSRELIKKLGTLASRFEAQKLGRQVYIRNRVKAMNESIYYNVDALHEAMPPAGRSAFNILNTTSKKSGYSARTGSGISFARSLFPGPRKTII